MNPSTLVPIKTDAFTSFIDRKAVATIRLVSLMIAPAAVGCKRRSGICQFDAHAEVRGSHVFNVEDTPRIRNRRLRGGVDGKRPHRDHASGRRDTVHCGLLACKV